MPSSMLTYRYRIKDATSRKHLQQMAWAVNRVFNFCNEVSLLAWRREKRFLSAFELINLTAGAGHELGLHTDTGYPLKAGQLTYDCRYSTMHGMPVTGGRGFRGLKPLWYNSVPP
jgi:hypothetical protein